MADMTDMDVLLSDRYRIGEVLGSGATGHVLAAHDVLLDKPVAVKVLDGLPDEIASSRALRAVRVAARCTHPRLIRVLDAERGKPAFVVLQRVDGRCLSEVSLDPDEAATVSDDVLAALAALHDSGGVHRDVRLDNVLLNHHGRGVLTASGLARAAHDRGLGLRVGGAENEQLADTRSDVAAAAEVVRTLLAPQLGSQLDAVLRRAVSADVDARPQDAGALRMLVTDALRLDAQEQTVPLATLSSRPLPARSADRPDPKTAKAETARAPAAPSSGGGESQQRSRLAQVALVLASVVAAVLLVIIPLVEGARGEWFEAGPAEEDVDAVLALAYTSSADLGPETNDLIAGLDALDRFRGPEREAQVAGLYGTAAVLARTETPGAPIADEAAQLLQPLVTVNGLVGLAEREPEAVGSLGASLAIRLRALQEIQDPQRQSEAAELLDFAEQGLQEGGLTPSFHAAVQVVLRPFAAGEQ